MSTIILANGRFPKHSIPLAILKSASRIVCCDGSVEHIDAINIEPFAIVGDLDSLPEKFKVKYADRIYYNPDQESNDLTKSILWCKSRGYDNIIILAGTGKRDDHTLGNIGLLSRYRAMGMNVKMVTDYGIFTPHQKGEKLDSFKGQQVSIFSFNNSTKITTHNLKYPIHKKELKDPWMGTLNESLGDWFEVEFEPGPIIVFQTHR